jgi:hypothetical protein
LDLICEAKSLFTNKHHLNIDINGWKVCSIRCNWVGRLGFRGGRGGRHIQGLACRGTLVLLLGALCCDLFSLKRLPLKIRIKYAKDSVLYKY